MKRVSDALGIHFV